MTRSPPCLGKKGCPLDITSYPGKPLPPNVQRFVQGLAKLEELVMQGKATTLEHVVYLTADHAVRHARDDEELWTMLSQCREHVVAFAAGNRFPPAYSQSYAHAGLRYQQLMDTLPPYPLSERAQAAGEVATIRRKRRRAATKRTER